MAKKSKIAANEKRKVIVARHAVARAEAKKTILSVTASDEAKAAAFAVIAKQPRDASATRVRNRDQVDGRPRGILSDFMLSRVRFREMAHKGELPGITKSSW